MFGLRFASPEWLLLLVFVPLLVFLRSRRDGGSARSYVHYTDLRILRRLGPTLGVRLYPMLSVLQVCGLICLILALARPQSSGEVRRADDGIDIVLTLDVSSSMELMDLAQGRKSRLQVAKEVLADFIAGRTSDRLGMVVFAAESFTQCPLTLDYRILQDLLAHVSIADEAWDGTAIGMALINACNRLRKTRGRSRVIILLTDGVNNAGEIEPLTAADVAAAVGVKIYAIGVGTQGVIRRPVRGAFGTRYQTVQVELDEELLGEVAARTGGRYFHATSAQKLEEIYAEISQLETTEIVSSTPAVYNEHFAWLLWPGLILLSAELLLASTRFRRIP